MCTLQNVLKFGLLNENSLGNVNGAQSKLFRVIY